MHRQRGRALHAMLYRLTLDSSATADLLQELFLHLARSPGFLSAADPVGYAYRAAMNLAANHRRASARRAAAQIRIAPAGQSALPVESAIQHEECQRVLDALATIPDAPREAFILRHIEQWSYQDIAARLNTTAHGARATAHRAVRLLRERLRGDAGLRDSYARPD